jgi:UDP-2,3-diacylglucosamine pyrophosphatase LpxH
MQRQLDIAVISDTHLGTYGCKAIELLAYLKSINPQILILNGDIIDIWQFSKHFFPSSHVLVIKEIFNLMSKGTRIIYITGNHDESLRKYSDFDMGNLCITDKLVIEINNKKNWIFHGDVFDNTTKGAGKFWSKLGSNGYAVLLATNKVINYFNRLLGRENVSFSKAIMKHVNKAIIKINDFETLAAEIAIEKKYDFVICGHIHQPQKRIISNSQGSVTYLNSGDWIEHLTALEFYKDDWHLFEYKHASEEKIIKKTSVNKPKPEVITDDVDLIIHSLI